MDQNDDLESRYRLASDGEPTDPPPMPWPVLVLAGGAALCLVALMAMTFFGGAR